MIAHLVVFGFRADSDSATVEAFGAELARYLDDAGHQAITARYTETLFDSRHAVQFLLD